MADRLRIALAQLNPKVGALAANLELARAALADAAAAGADILLLSELFLTGYFPEDLFFKPRFVEDALGAAAELVRATKGSPVSLLLPTIWREGQHLYNAVLLAEDGKVVARRYKHDLPNDDVFYEKRYFAAGPLPEPIDDQGRQHRRADLRGHLAPPGVANISSRRAPSCCSAPMARPTGRTSSIPARIWSARAPPRTRCRCSISTRSAGRTSWCSTAPRSAWSRAIDWCSRARASRATSSSPTGSAARHGWRCTKGEVVPLASIEEAPWQAMLRGLRDYVRKNGFSKVVLGLSGGIDSAIVAAIAADALGPENVHCVMLPYRYTVGGEPARRQGLRRAARRALRHRLDRRAGGRGAATNCSRCSAMRAAT